jgi:hypothetical protein
LSEIQLDFFQTPNASRRMWLSFKYASCLAIFVRVPSNTWTFFLAIILQLLISPATETRAQVASVANLMLPVRRVEGRAVKLIAP